MHHFLILTLSGLSIANDMLLPDTSIPSTFTTTADGSLRTIIPMVMRDLRELTTTPTVTASVTGVADNELQRLSHEFVVHPPAIWRRDAPQGPPVRIAHSALKPDSAANGEIGPPPRRKKEVSRVSLQALSPNANKQ